ncbi:cardiolipin synthase (CMP-forming), mitochondrial [Heracleum sosnowskyi]|uniref:Cardiolipin synthase (CMP-forming), mitochondrial n=1 Tax=Heracleum sosnowskyi TaxID=360622 RepID=A0AAD8I5J6_9APIA|nr:cardiolipin synthase (CMP-forming), mitochondrial [Heracleum sosnowskyi]
MGIFLRSLRKLTQHSKSQQPIFNLTSILNPTCLFLSKTHSISPSLSPLSKCLQSPLFLSSHPFTLSQSATRFYSQPHLVFLPSVQALVSPNFSRVGSGEENVGGGDQVEKGGGVNWFVNLPNFSRVNFVSKRVGSGVENLGGGDPVEKGGGGGGGFVNLPNLISMSRLISGPVIGWMILQEMYLPAFGCLAVSGATDWLDGYVARKMGINSVVGSYLDPLADKVLIGSVALAMVEKGLLNSGLVGIIVLRDVALVGGAIYNRASSLNWNWKSWSDYFNLDGIQAQKVEPLFLSKVNTVFQLLLVTAALLQPDIGTQDTQSYITYLSWLVASTTVASTAAYGVQHLRRKHMLRKGL